MSKIKIKLICFICKFLESYRRKQYELMQAKLKFLEYEAYKNFYNQFLLRHSLRIAGSIDIHPCIYAMHDARLMAKKVVGQIAERGRVNQCYLARVNELRK